MAEGGGRVALNVDHIVAVKKRDGGGYRVWLSTDLEVGDGATACLSWRAPVDPRTCAF